MTLPIRTRWSTATAVSILAVVLLFVAGLCIPVPAYAQGCEQGPECDTVSPTVTVSGGNTQNQVVTVTIDWCDNLSLNGDTRSIKLNGTDVTGSLDYTAASATSGCAVHRTSTGDLTLSPGINTIVATIEDVIGNIGTGSNSYVYANGFVSVTPKGVTVTRPRLAALTDTFSVTNLGSTTATFKLAATCTGGASSCATLDTVRILPDSTKRVAVSYQSGSISAGSGVVSLRARLFTDSTVADSGSIAVSPAQSMIVDASINANEAQDMRLCAYACFNNIYARSTVPYYSLDQPRGVTLVTNSLRSFTYPYVHVDLTFLKQSPAVDRIELLVRDSANPAQALSLLGGSNNTYGPVYFSRNNADTSSSPIRIATMIGSNGDNDQWVVQHGTGIHPLTVTVIAVRSTYSDTATVTVPLLIVREPPGAVARGWYVAGMQRLLPQSGDRVIIAEADGSAFVFRYDSAAAVYHGPESDLTKLTKSTSGGVTTYTRTYPDSSNARFDSAGQMLDATDSWGKRTRYAYDTQGRLSRIYDPIRPRADSAGGLAYTEFAYTSGAVAIRPPRGDGTSFDSSRVTMLRLNTDSSLRAIVDPDGDSTRFTYRKTMNYPWHDRQTVLHEVFDRNGNLSPRPLAELVGFDVEFASDLRDGHALCLALVH